jgi:uncharacterized membrane protein YkoI
MKNRSATQRTCLTATRLVAAQLAALAATLMVAMPAAADSRRDHERARAAVEAGEVMPLAKVLERLATTHPGQVLEVELERDDGRWLYEVRLLHRDGRLMKLELDARTAKVLSERTRSRLPRQPDAEASR